MRDLELLTYLFIWIDKHKTFTNVIPWLDIIAIAWVVITYSFTAHI